MMGLSAIIGPVFLQHRTYQLLQHREIPDERMKNQTIDTRPIVNLDFFIIFYYSEIKSRWYNIPVLSSDHHLICTHGSEESGERMSNNRKIIKMIITCTCRQAIWYTSPESLLDIA